MHKVLNHPSPPREPRPCLAQVRDGRALWGAEGPGRQSPSLQGQSSLLGPFRCPTQEKDAFLSRHRGSQWAIHGVQEKYLWSCISWEMEGAWAVGGGRPACWECPVPGARPAPYLTPPTPLAGLFQQVQGSLGSSSLGPAHTGPALRARGARRNRVLCSALKCPPPLPICNVPLIPGACRRGGRATLQPFLLGQGRCGTLETITRNFVYSKYHLSLLCALASSLLQKVVQRGPSSDPDKWANLIFVYEILP